MARLQTGQPMPKPGDTKVIQIGGLNSPSVLGGVNKSNTIQVPPNTGYFIVDVKDTPKSHSITVKELMDVWKNTGNLLQTEETNIIKVGDTVMVLEEGLEYMGPLYWMNTEKNRVWKVTKDFTKYAGGTYLGCPDGALPPTRYMRVISSEFDKGWVELPRELRDNDYIDIIINTMHKEYGDDTVSSEDRDALWQQIKNAHTDNGGYIHGLYVDAPDFTINIIAEGQARQYLIDHFTDADPYYLGGWNHKVFNECYPEIADALIALANTEAYEQVGNTILKIGDGIDRLVNYLITKYGMQQTIGDHLNYSDGKALEFVYYGNKYYIVREE